MKSPLLMVLSVVCCVGAAGAEQGLLLLRPCVSESDKQPETWELDLTSLDAKAAVEAAKGLSTRLYGTPSRLHAPLVIKTRCDQRKIFAFRLRYVSSTGGTLTVTCNDKVVFRKTWPSAQAEHEVDTVWHFPLPGGPAKVALEISRGNARIEAYYIADAIALLPSGAQEADVDVPPKAAVRPPLTGTIGGYRGIWFTLGQFTAHGDKYSGGLGTYTANHNPLAVHAPEVNKTFFTYGGTTAKQDRRLLIMASYYDHQTGTVPRPVIVHDKQGVDDPHDNGSINIAPDGHIWIFFSGRGRQRPGFKYRSKEPYSIAAFERISEEEMTYPQPWPLPGRGWLHLFTKYTRGRELYWETSADGRTWTDDRKLAGFGGHYQVSGARGGMVATFFNYHPGGNVDRRTNLYYLQTADGGRTWTTADRKPVAVPLGEINNPALVVDYEAQGLLMYTCDLNLDRAGNPLLLYVTSRGYAPGPENDPREFRLSRWTGSRWETRTVAKTDHNYDMGSLWVGRNEWVVVAPTHPGPQPYGGGGEMCLWSSADQGRTWTMKRQITRNSPRNHNYARRPVNARDPFFAFWADGNPNEFGESLLYFCDSTGERVWQLPYDMEGDTARPIRVR